MVKFRWETEFKETEIGKIPKDWEVKRIEDLVKDVIVGSTPLRKKDEYWKNGTIPWLTNKELEYDKINYITDTEEKVSEIALRETNLKLVPPFSLIVSFTASVGKVAINKVPITTNQQFISFVLHKRCNVRYFGYYFVLSKELIESFSSATPFNFVTKESALKLPVPYPPPEEQTRIATVLSWFDDLIENKKRQNEILEKTAMAIFKSWFIDFEPFQDEEFSYSEELDMEIPKGWEVKPIGEVADATSGFSYKSSEKLETPDPDSYVFITLKNTVEGGGFKPEYAWIKSRRLKERHFLQEGDLILPNTEQTKDARLLGSPGIVVFPPDYTKEKGVYSMDVVKVEPEKEYYKYYLYFNFRINRKRIATFHSGTNILHFKIQNFKENYYVPLPPDDILQRFHSLIEPLFQKILLNEKEIMTLKKVRDLLLLQLVFGRLRVEEL